MPYLRILIALVILAKSVAFSASVGPDHSWQRVSPLPHGETFNDLRFFAGYHVATTNRGTILVSSDGSTWRVVHDLTFISPINRLSVGRDAIFASTADGMILRSPDALHWTTVFHRRTLSWVDVLDTGTAYEAVSSDGILARSSDGISWSIVGPISTTLSGPIQDIAFGNGVYVFGQKQLAAATLLVSPDLNSWTTVAPPIVTPSVYTSPFDDIEFGGGRFVFVGGYENVATSTDGYNWTVQTQFLDSNGASPRVVRYVNGQWFASGYRSSLRSNDGITWEKFYVSPWLTPFSFGHGVYLSNTASSTDGITWTQNSAPVLGRFTSVGHGVGRFWVTGIYGNTWTSFDGHHWSREWVPTSQTMNDLYADENIVIIAGWDGVIQTRTADRPWSHTSPQSGRIVWRLLKFKGAYYAFTDNGHYRSDDGFTWTFNDSQVSGHSGYADDHVMLVGRVGNLFATTDGTNFDAKNIGSMWPLSLIRFDDVYYRFEYDGSLHTSTDGFNWILRGAFYAHADHSITLVRPEQVSGLPSTSRALPKPNQDWNQFNLIEDRLVLSYGKNAGSIATRDGQSWFFDDTPYGSVATDGKHVVAVAGDDKVVVRRTDPGGRLSNISTRTTFPVEGDPLVVGVVTAGGPKTLLVRAAGPSLRDYGITNPATDPAVQVFRNSVPGDENNDWDDTPNLDELTTRMADLGSFPFAAGATDAALLTTLDAGATTINIRDRTGPRGVGLAEILDADPSGSLTRITNLSALREVGTGEEILVAGFVVVDAPVTLLIRGVGPTLADFGVTNALPASRLEIHRNGEVIASSDAWWDHPLSAETVFYQQQLGAFALRDYSEDAALVITLEPGVYTASLSGSTAQTGQGLIELYLVTR